MPKKRLIVCFDGTWNSADKGDRPTNVVKLMSAIVPQDERGTPQIVFYDAGVGADSGRVDRVIDGATGRGLVQNVRDGYRFLAHNYLPGDEVYIFGFSRGAFTARSLCGFMRLCGLLRNGEIEGRLRKAWDLYQQPETERDRAELDKIHEAGYRDPNVKCLGVWDTVGALGVPGELLQGLNRKHQFHDTELCPLVEHAFHALAIDEKRGPFAPTLWQKPKDEALTQKVVEQVWFPGVHSNVGGSYPDAGLSDLALEWLMGRVEDVSDLEFDGAYVDRAIRPDPLGEIYESRSAAYVASRVYPYQRLIGQSEVGGSFLRGWIERRNRPEGDGCEFVNELIHWSAEERFGQIARENGEDRRYQPENLKAALGKVPVVPRRAGRPGRREPPAIAAE